MNREDIIAQKKYIIIGDKEHNFKIGEVVTCVKRYADGQTDLYGNGEIKQFVFPEDVTPYIEPREEVSDIELAARNQYYNVGYDKDDGTMSLYIKGAEFGTNWQKEQTKALQESHDKLLQLLFDSRPLIQPAVYCKNDDFIFLKSKIDTAIENAKNYAKK